MGNLVEFIILVKDGDLSFNGSKEEEKLKQLLKKGPNELIIYLQCLAHGIVELQNVGLFHEDLKLSNTILVFEKKYQIIDFDYAFRVRHDDYDSFKGVS